jgi:ArsR family transcriptional regulator, arsenate/arsenite/antimonite-responsive transcriptional repressor
MKPAMKFCCPPAPKNEGRGLKVMDEDRDLAALAKALGHPARVKILKVLKTAGFIRGTISGPATCYCVEPSAFSRLRLWLGDLRKRS